MSNPVVTSPTIDGVPGDAPALGELIITNAGAAHVRFLMWGEGPDTTSPLLLDSDSLVITGFIGTGNTRAGAYDPNATGNNVIRATLPSIPAAVCGTGEQPHQGTFRVIARVFTTETTTYIRLAWQDKDGPLAANRWAQPPVVDAWGLVDLGVITLAASPLGDQVWSGQVEAYDDVAGTLDVDFVALIPVDEGYGVARGETPFANPTTFNARDEFNQTAGALAGKTLVVGGTWAGAGDTDDFTVDATDHVAVRAPAGADASETAGRFAIAGTSTFTDTAVQADFRANSPLGVIGSNRYSVFARYVDTNNWLALWYSVTVIDVAPNLFWSHTFRLVKRVAGTLTVIAQGFPPTALGAGGVVGESIFDGATWHTLHLRAYADGRVHGYYQRQGSSARAPELFLQGQHADLATGGALASGKVGIYDAYTAGSRRYDNFLAYIPADPIVIYSGQDMRVRHDGALRADVDSGRYGPPPLYQPAGHFYVQPAGDAERGTRIAVLANPKDLRVSTWDVIDHPIQVQALWTPRGNAIPR